METENAVSFQTRTRQLFRLRSYLTTLRNEGNKAMSTPDFKIVTGASNHTGVAIFNYDGHAIHITPNQNDDASSIFVYPTDGRGVLTSGVSVFGPVSATLPNLCRAREYIDNQNPEYDGD